MVYRDFPLPNHAQASKAAEAAQCAHLQGRFWDYHDRLFGTFGQLAPEDLKQHAAAVGLDEPEFAACLDGSRTKEAVQQDIAQGQALGVSATPTFFINGRTISGAQPFETFQSLIDDELQRTQ